MTEEQLALALAQAKAIRDRTFELDEAITAHVAFLSGLDDERLAPIATTLPFRTKADADEAEGLDRYEQEHRG